MRQSLLGRSTLVALLLSAVVGVACVPPLPDPEVVQTLAPGSREILLARQALEPVVPAAVSDIQMLATGVDQARHDVQRGSVMRDFVAELQDVADSLETSVQELAAIADQMQSSSTQDAEDIVGRLVQNGQATVAEARSDLAQLDPILAFDAQLQTTVDAWNQAGARPVLAEAFTALADLAQAEVASARRLAVGRCQDMRTNRIRWADLVLNRTEQLRDAALNGQGTTFDELRRRFSRAPYGEDQQVADSESRACWTRSSPLPDHAAQAAALLRDLQESLRG